MSIAFNQLQATLVPGVRVEIDPSRSVRGLPGQPFKILVIGQRLAVGTVAAATLKLVTRDDQAPQYWGAHSQITRLIAALREVNRETEVWGVALDDDGAAVAAAGTITLSGTPSGGVLGLYIAGVRLQISITSDLVASAAALAAAINAHASLPVQAAVNPGQQEQVIVTALNGGEAGNDIDMRDSYNPGEIRPDGLTVTYVAMASGAGDPDISTAITVLPGETYNLIVLPWTGTANLAALEAELEARWDGNTMTDGVAIAAKAGSVAALTTFAGTSLDSAYQVVLGINKSPTPPAELAARAAGLVASSAQSDPARGFTGMELTGALAPAAEDRFTRQERDLLLTAGIATMVTSASGEVALERMVTNYVIDAGLRDLTTMLTLSYVRWSWVERISRKFLTQRFKLKDDDGIPVAGGQRVLTPLRLKDEGIAWFKDLADAALVENLAQFKADSIFQRQGPNALQTLLAVDIINPLYNVDALLQHRL